MFEHRQTYILVLPEHQNKGYGTAVIDDIKNGILPYEFDTIEVSVDKTNTAPIRLFEKCGFVCVSKEEELLNFVYECRKKVAPGTENTGLRMFFERITDSKPRKA